MSDASLPTIGMLWVEGPLSYLEQLSILSFRAQGHRVVLFHYGSVENVPGDIELVSANEVHQPSEIIFNKQFQTPVPQSDIFRLQMMKKTDFVWSDTDVLAVKPIRRQDHVFGYFNKTTLCNAVMRMPADAPALDAYLAHALDPYPIMPWVAGEERARLEQMRAEGTLPHASEQKHSVYGPAVMTWFLQEHGGLDHAQAVPVFYPLPFRQAGAVNDLHAREFRQTYIKDETVAIHLWGRRLRWWVAGGVKRHSFLDRRLRGLGLRPSDAPVPNTLRKAEKKLGFPPKMPALQLQPTEISAAIDNMATPQAVQQMTPFLRFAQWSFDEIAEHGLYGIHDQPRAGYQRGWDFYATDGARLHALARSINRYTNNHKALPDFVAPRSCTEKLLVMKMFGEMPAVSPADKLLAEDHVPEDAQPLFTPIRRFWASPDPVLPPDSELPNGSYWLKGNYGQGLNLRLDWPLDADQRADIGSRLARWGTMPGAHGFWAGEWWYATIDRKYFIEQDLAVAGADIIDWKFWVVAGRVQLVQVDRDRSRGHVQMIHDRDFNYIPQELYFKTSADVEQRPARYDDMVKLAEAIGQTLEFARVDLYCIGDQIYIGEITLCPFGGKRRMNTPAIDRALGALWSGTRLFPDAAADMARDISPDLFTGPNKVA